MSASLCPPNTSIAVERDLVTGDLLGYREVSVVVGVVKAWSHFVQVDQEGAGLTPMNSTSLKRAPGRHGSSIKGDSTNFPFWPGVAYRLVPMLKN